MTVMQVLAKSGRLSVQAQNGFVRRTSSRSGNKATRPTRSRETLPLAGFSFVLRLFAALTTSEAVFPESALQVLTAADLITNPKGSALIPIQVLL